MANSIQQLLEDVESLKNILAAKATGERADEYRYRKLQRRLTAHDLVKDRLPRFVRTCGTLGEFWPFIKEQSSTYAGRRRFLAKEFENVLGFLGQQASALASEPSHQPSKILSSSNVFAGVPSHIQEEIAQTLVRSPHVRVERIVSHGHASPTDYWYDQGQNEWVLVVQGHARLQFDDNTIELKAGDYLNIPAHIRHRVDWTTLEEPTIWLALYY